MAPNRPAGLLGSQGPRDRIGAVSTGVAACDPLAAARRAAAQGIGAKQSGSKRMCVCSNRGIAGCLDSILGQ